MESDDQSSLPWDNNSWDVAAQIAPRSQMAARSHPYVAAVAMGLSGAMTGEPHLVLRTRPEPITQLLLQAVVAPEQGADRGKLVVAVLYPWFDIIKLLEQDPSAAFRFPWDKWEEMIADIPGEDLRR
jgi:hypothetical protein